MPSRKVQLVILCEDLQQEVFARHFFLRHGFDSRKFRIKRSPRGKGSAEQYVCEQYPHEVRTYRSKSTHLAILLAVVIDADTYTVQQRLNQLDTALGNAAESSRQADEEIAIFVPKRNIETWIHYLMEENVDEDTVYGKLPRQSDCKPYVEELVNNICPAGLPQDAPPSLHVAYDELQRIL